MQPPSDATRSGVYASHGWRTSILGKDRKSIIEIGDQFPIAESKSDFLCNPRVWHPVSFGFEKMKGKKSFFSGGKARQDGQLSQVRAPQDF